MADTTTAAPCRVSRDATQPMRSTFASRSSFENPSPCERCMRTMSPSSFSTRRPRSSNAGPTRSAIVVLPDPERPVNQSVNPITSYECRTRSSTRRNPWFPREPPPSLNASLGASLCVNPALDLVRVGPAPRALVLLTAHRPRTRDAPDGRVARVVERVVRDLVHEDVRVDALRVPVDERLDLPHVVALAELDALRVLAREALLAADAGDPRVVVLQRALERLHLAHVAAAVGVRLPQVRTLLLVLLGDGDDVGPDQLEPVLLDELLACLVRLAEEERGVELDDGDVEAELADHVHEHRRLLLPGAGEAELGAEAVVGPEEALLRRHRLDVRKLEQARHRAAPPSGCHRAARGEGSRAG